MIPRKTSIIAGNIHHGLLACAILLTLATGCSKETLSGSDSPDTPPPVFSGPDPNMGLDVRKLAAEADSYSITYGALTPATINTLKTYPLVIVHPYNGDVTRDQIMQIKQGVKADDPSDNVVVLCYISVGEDSRTYRLSDDDMRNDARFTGDGSGPVIDPRGSGPSGRALTGLNPKGTATNGGFASYYLNDNAVRCKGEPDKSPDQNGNFLTRFVNAGDPAWYETVRDMQMNIGTHTQPGLQELFTATSGRGLGCDGVFLDTIDTAAPNKYTSCSDSNHSSSEWTAKGFSDFIRRVRADYPDKVILQNRGLFFFDPREPHYQVSARSAIDIGYFESYYLDNDIDHTVSLYAPDNKHNMTPKIMAEANRPDGFKMLSLGYASGFDSNGFDSPKPGLDIQTLFGNSTIGSEIFMKDMGEAYDAGFRHYITNANIDLVNSFVKDNITLDDTSPPVWSSVFNIHYDEYPVIPPEEALGPNKRTGIQKIKVNEDGSVTISWDVALDMNKVSYALYYKTTPFDAGANPSVSAAVRTLLSPSMGAKYDQVWNCYSPNGQPSIDCNPSLALESVYPYQQKIALPGLQSGTTYYLLLRAVDSKGNEDLNTNIWECSNTTCSIF